MVESPLGTTKRRNKMKYLLSYGAFLSLIFVSVGYKDKIATTWGDIKSQR